MSLLTFLILFSAEAFLSCLTIMLDMLILVSGRWSLLWLPRFKIPAAITSADLELIIHIACSNIKNNFIRLFPYKWFQIIFHVFGFTSRVRFYSNALFVIRQFPAVNMLDNGIACFEN